MPRQRLIRLENICYPVEVHYEDRRNARAASGARGVIIRIPKHLSGRDRERQVQDLMAWARDRLRQRPRALQPTYRRLQDGEPLVLDGATYRLTIVTEERKTSAARLEDGVLAVILSDRLPAGDRDETVVRLASRCIGAARLPELERTVAALNRRHFRRPLGRIRFKYNRRSWGSCSTRGNINISTRLLFAPGSVLEYVCIHELAHLVEMNHSPRFWALVEKAMPGYEDHERWLKTNGDKLWF